MTDRYRYISACIAFFIAGFILSCWSPLVPIVKAHLSLSDGSMGIILLLFGIGSLVSMPIAGHLAHKFGCRCIMSISLICACCALIALSLSYNVYILSLCLFLFGVFVGTMDVVANINAALIQNKIKKPIMSSLHALFSLGAFAGSGSVSLGLYFKAVPKLTIPILISIIIPVYFIVHKGLTVDKSEESSSGFSLPSKSIILLGISCWIAYLVEGSMLDWSGIFLNTRNHNDMNITGFAFTSFSAAMVCGRIFGDYVTKTLGEKKTFRFSMLILLAGIITMVSSHSLLFLFTSFFLVGIGLANIAPLLFSLASHRNPENISSSIAQVSTLGYLGILLGPAIIGGIASMTSITGSFYVIAFIIACLCTLSFTKILVK